MLEKAWRRQQEMLRRPYLCPCMDTLLLLGPVRAMLPQEYSPNQVHGPSETITWPLEPFGMEVCLVGRGNWVQAGPGPWFLGATPPAPLSCTPTLLPCQKIWP